MICRVSFALLLEQKLQYVKKKVGGTSVAGSAIKKWQMSGDTPNAI
jgi:hypothetical protein